MSFNIPGLDKIKDLFGDHLKDLPIDELLNSDFVKKYTNSSSLNELLAKFGVSADKVEDLIKQPNIDEKVKENTQFSNLKEMIEKAAGELKK